ncbi:MAG: trypsin-like serine protease [Dehalococcoidia bacterium]|nr:trypsin-like serine protease [Dehalococcoidia bacterium]
MEIELEDGPRQNLPPLGWLAAVIVVAVVIGAASGAVVTLLLGGSDADNDPAAMAEMADGDAVAQVAARAMPSVVAIINELSAQPGSIAGGAGVIIDERGFILTNAHIITEPGKLTVLLANGEARPATIVSHDAPFTDLAVLRVPAGGLRPLALGDSETLRPGQTVMAIGSPDIDYMNSVTTGVVSAVHRRKALRGVWAEDLIQTDTAINVGNSGGPLINLRGQIVGLISFRDIGREDPLFGISFAISSRTILPIARAMIDEGKFPRPYFGIDHQNVDDELIQTSNLRVDHGALVRRVIDGSPAQKAGIQTGDILLRLGRNDITEQLPFINALAQVGLDERLPVQLWREGRVMAVEMEITPR